MNEDNIAERLRSYFDFFEFGPRTNENYPEPKNLATLRKFFGVFPIDDVIKYLKALKLIISDHDFMDDASF